MSATLFLSHPLSPETPGYGGRPGFASQAATQICNGDSSNSLSYSLSNHIGTHVDAPKHFSDQGVSVDSYLAEDWVFEQICIVDLPTAPAQLIAPGAWLKRVPATTELLLIRTGFEAFRQERKYWEENPGLSPELAVELRTKHPTLRAVGVDFLSITSWQHREVGRAAHRAFLDPSHQGRPLLLIEDMALARAKGKLSWAVVAPIRIVGADGAQVTVIAKSTHPAKG